MYKQSKIVKIKIEANLNLFRGLNMKTSARNKIEGRINNIELGKVAANVKIEIGSGEIITAVITKESVEKMNLKKDDEVDAIIKATSVMIAKE